MLCRIPYFTKVFFLNPKLLFKKVLGRILLEVIPSPKGAVQVNIGGYTIEMWPSQNDWWKYKYLGYAYIEIVHNIKKYLPPSGIFINVGAGMGYFSAIASDIVGDLGQVHCFEPYYSNVKAIQRMIKSKPNSNIILNDYALGADDGIHNYYIQRSVNFTESSMIDNFFEKVDETIEVRTKRLDSYLEQKNIDEVSLIKIDVEGYEYFILKGLSGFFEMAKQKPPIICEIYMPVYKKSDLSLSEFHAYMKNYGYQACNIFNPRKRVDIRLLNETSDVIFMPVQ